MKQLYVFSILVLFVLSCGQKNEKTKANLELGSDSFSISTLYGDTTVIYKNYLTVDDLYIALEGKDSIQVQVAGNIEAVCQTAGCWLKLKGTDKSVMARTGETFFFPKEIAGKNAVVSGYAQWEETDEESRKHLAEDAGASKTEIDSIKGPEKNLVIWINSARIK